MKIHVEELHLGGIIAEGDDPAGVVVYGIVNGETGSPVVDRDFDSYEAADAYIAQHFPDTEPWTPPPAGAEDVARVMPMINLLETSPDSLMAAASTANLVRRILRGELRQRTHAPELAARIRVLLAGFE